MSGTPVLSLAGAVALLAGNAFFVGAEFAITSARRSQLEPLAQAGDSRAKTALWALENVSRMLATAQLGVTLCSTGLGVVAEPALAHLLSVPLETIGAPQGSAHALAVVIALVVVVFFHVVVGEMVPKNLSIASPESAAKLFAPPLVALSRLLSPVITALNGVANFCLRLVRIEPKDEVSAAYTVEEVANIVELSTAEGVLDDEVGLLSGALEFSEETAGSVMVPLEAVVGLTPQCTPADVEREVARTGYSRFPLVERGDDGAIRQVRGYVHLKDVLFAEGPQRDEPLPRWIPRALVALHPDDEVETVLVAMQRTGAHLGQVCDETGVTLGVVFLEDILEELVGEVHDAMQKRLRQGK